MMALIDYYNHFNYQNVKREIRVLGNIQFVPEWFSEKSAFES